MRGLLFLLSARFLLESTKGKEYDKLDDNDRKIVDKAIRIKEKHNNMLNVILRPTSCDKTTPSVHRKEFEIHNKPPQVSCIHCNGTMKPCLLLRQKDEVNQILLHYFAGRAHLLFRIGEDEQQQTGCLGCI
uniref:Uncharacterized protein n=1 Tax=Sinocyclocheilus rhinocerous TaxID=307959 RepID=A0A673JA80_9TELE